MMDLAKRIEAMGKLPKHIGEIVHVNYVNQFNQQKSIVGTLKEVLPYSDIVVTHLDQVPDKIRCVSAFNGLNIFKRSTGIPFLGSPVAIMSVQAKDRSVLYENEHVHPFYNPHFKSDNDENPDLTSGIDYKAGKAYTAKTRELSFGRK